MYSSENQKKNKRKKSRRGRIKSLKNRKKRNIKNSIKFVDNMISKFEEQDSKISKSYINSVVDRYAHIGENKP